jgi:hypothetical protein
MVNVSTGEITCFGGRLPFYSFTNEHGINYARGATVHLEVVYRPHALSDADPATIQYRLIMSGTTYESPALPFDSGNPAKDPPYGLYGILNDARVGGYFQPRADTGVALTAAWSNIDFSSPDCACVDGAPPTLDVTVDRSVLWPPNHRMANITTTVEVTDDCDDAPVITLVSVTCHEAEDAPGSGHTAPDIVIVDDTHFQLRSERVGGGDSRVYTITYTASDLAGNSTTASVEVRVPHDQSGRAQAYAGFSADGTNFGPRAEIFALAIPSSPEIKGFDPGGHPAVLQAAFDATRLEPDHVYVGNTAGVISPVRSMTVDADGESATVLATDGPLGLHYELGGADFLVPDILALGGGESRGLSSASGDSGGLAGKPGQDQETRTQQQLISESVPEVTGISGARPNPFNPMTTIRFSLRSDSRVVLNVYDFRGVLIRQLENGPLSAGYHEVLWDGKDKSGRSVAAGVYLVSMVAGDVHSTCKLALIK